MDNAQKHNSCYYISPAHLDPVVYADKQSRLYVLTNAYRLARRQYLCLINRRLTKLRRERLQLYPYTKKNLLLNTPTTQLKPNL
jgi:hypothetical protein